MASVSIDNSGSEDGRIQELDDDFDVDNMDFDLPSTPVAPSRPSAASSSRGPLPPQMSAAQQQAMLNSFAGAPSGSGLPFGGGGAASRTRMVNAEDPSKYKHYQTIYPIYIDAARARKNGERRVSKAKAIRFPKAQEIAEVCGRFFGLSPLFEPDKSHPRDWANPGRVRVLLKDEKGKFMNPKITDSESHRLNVRCSFG